jgi:phosphocarrier protein
VRICNRLGLHARAAARFVQTANRFRARITASRDGRTMDGKSILGMLLLAASEGTVLELSAEGDDAEDALAALAQLLGQLQVLRPDHPLVVQHVLVSLQQLLRAMGCLVAIECQRWIAFMKSRRRHRVRSPSRCKAQVNHGSRTASCLRIS